MSLFQELKAGTKEEHAHLESSLDLLREDFSLDDYKNVLTKFWGVYRPLEEKLREHFFAEFYEGRWKVPLIKKDLLSLGFSENEIESIPVEKNISSLENLNEIIGTLYVLEGSSLGSLILSRHFGFKFGLTSLKGMSFFTSYGEETLTKWKEWREFSEAFSREENLSHQLIVSAARRTFLLLKNWMG